MAVATKSRPVIKNVSEVIVDADKAIAAFDKRYARDNTLTNYKAGMTDSLSAAVTGDTKFSVYLALLVLWLVIHKHPVINLGWLRDATAGKIKSELMNATVMRYVIGQSPVAHDKSEAEKDRYARTKNKVRMAFSRLLPLFEVTVRKDCAADIGATDDGQFLTVPGKLIGTTLPRVALDKSKSIKTKGGKGVVSYVTHLYKKKGEEVLVQATIDDFVAFNRLDPTKAPLPKKAAAKANAGQGAKGATEGKAKPEDKAIIFNAGPNTPANNVAALRKAVDAAIADPKGHPLARNVADDGFLFAAALFKLVGERAFFKRVREAAGLYKPAAPKAKRAPRRPSDDNRATDAALAGNIPLTGNGNGKATEPATTDTPPAGK